MNQERRKNLLKLKEELQKFAVANLPAARQLLTAATELKADLESCQEEEQEAFDNMPEGLQSGDKGERAQAAIDALGIAVDEAGNVEEKLNNIVDAVDGIEEDCQAIESAIDEATDA